MIYYQSEAAPTEWQSFEAIEKWATEQEYPFYYEGKYLVVQVFDELEVSINRSPEEGPNTISWRYFKKEDIEEATGSQQESPSDLLFTLTPKTPDAGDYKVFLNGMELKTWGMLSVNPAKGEITYSGFPTQEVLDLATSYVADVRPFETFKVVVSGEVELYKKVK